ncbi:MAG: glycosyltransferase family 4 protein [Thermomicrobiales bacterium]
MNRSFIIEPAADLVHFHSVFVPRQATLARELRRLGIPYVVTPHGGLMPQVLERGKAKKLVYSAFVERERIRKASGIAYVTPDGEGDIRKYIGQFDGPVHWVPNPVNIGQLQAHSWQPDGARPRLTFLGRYDVYHKGIDRLANVAQRIIDADFQLYGIRDQKTSRYLDVLEEFGPPNFHVNSPIFGEEKLSALSRSTMYVQLSRWEALSISILEAMAIGVPCVIGEGMSMASIFTTNDLGLVVSTNPDLAARQILAALDQPEQLRAWSERSRAYVIENFLPARVAERIITVYEEALDFYFSTGRGASFVTPIEGNGERSDPLTGFGNQHNQKKRDSKNFEYLFDRRQRGIEQVVDTFAASDDA